MLWEIDNTPHLILGSIHALPKDQRFPAWMRRVYFDTRRFVFEADATDQTILEIGVDQTGQHLQWPGTQDIYDRAKLLLHAIGKRERFDHLRPWRAAWFVSSALYSAALGVSPACGVESVFREHAKKHGLDVGYLEPPGRAFELFESCGEPYACLRLFQCLVADPRFATREFSRILKAWIAADIVEMAAIHRERMALFPKVFGSIITLRNREWILPALQFVKDSTPTTFIVGALHTVGPDSFIEQLRSAGLQLTRIPPTPRSHH